MSLLGEGTATGHRGTLLVTCSNQKQGDHKAYRVESRHMVTLLVPSRMDSNRLGGWYRTRVVSMPHLMCPGRRYSRVESVLASPLTTEAKAAAAGGFREAQPVVYGPFATGVSFLLENNPSCSVIAEG